MLIAHLATRIAVAALPLPAGAVPLPAQVVESTLPFAPVQAIVLPPSAPAVAPDAAANAVPEAAPDAETNAAPPVAEATTVDADDPALVDVRVPGEADPLAPLNRISWAITQPIDRFILRPAAIVYKTVLPKPLRDGTRNFLQNIHEPMVIFNDFLQLHPGRAIKGIGRMVVNSLFGIGGLFDVAKRKPFHIVHHDNSFGNTLGYFGMGPLLYLYLPVLGPTTLRDTGAGYVDDLVEPRLLYHLTHPDSDKPFWRTKTKLGKTSTIASVVSGLDQRAEHDQELEAIRTTSVDPYAALRASYLQDRAGEIAALRAKEGADAANPQLDDPLNDPAAGAAAAPGPAAVPPAH